MDKYKIYQGSAVNLPSTIDLIQSYVNGNFNKRFLKLTNTFGIIDSGLAVSILNSTTLSIAEGVCIFKNGEMSIIPATTFIIGSLTEGSSFILYLKFKEAQSEPVAAANSFYYNSSNVAKYTKFLDSYELLLGSYGRTEADDEMHLCSFTAGPGNTINQEIGLTDERTYFKIKTSILDRPLSIADTGTDLVLKPRDGERTLKIKDYNDFTLFSLNTNTGDVNYTIDENLNPTAKFTFNGPVKINGTLIVNDQEVELKPLSDTPPPAPKGFRITNISTIKQSNRLAQTDKVRVYFEWNYNNITGSGLSNGYFDITNTSLESYAENYFEGLYFYIPSLDKNFLIVDSAATSSLKTRIRVKDVELDSYPDLSTILITTSVAKGIINSNAQEYKIIKSTIENGVTLPPLTTQHTQAVTGSPTLQTTYLDLEPDKIYSFILKAIGSNKKESSVELEEGSFFKYGIANFYSKPVLLRHPMIPSTGSAVTLTKVGSNINVQITGFSEADSFEYVIGDSLQFNNENAYKGILAQRNFVIPADGRTGNITISIRPLIGGQEVGIPISATITSGTAATVTQDVPLFTIPISLNTISATLTKTSNTEVTISTIKSPAGDGSFINYTYSSLIKDILIDSAGKEFIIINATPSVTAGSYNLVITKAAGNSTEISAGSCLIGTGSVRSRLITNHPVNALLEINKIAFDQDAIYLLSSATSGVNDYVNLRIYASNNLNSSDVRSLKIREGADEITLQDFSSNPLIVDGTNNSITLSVDLYDPVDPTFTSTNKQGLLGTLFVYGKYSSTATKSAAQNYSTL